MLLEGKNAGFVLVLIAAWAAYSLSGLPPLDQPLPTEVAMPPLAVLAGLGVVLYVVAAARYYRVWRQRRRPLPSSVITAFVLLAEAVITIVFAHNWHATWWEWHLLMLAAFGIVAYTAHKQWREERLSDLYLEETRGRPVTSACSSPISRVSPPSPSAPTRCTSARC